MYEVNPIYLSKDDKHENELEESGVVHSAPY
jgi:hypothetical protein